MKNLAISFMLMLSLLTSGNAFAGDSDLPVGEQNVPLKLLDSAKIGNVLSDA